MYLLASLYLLALKETSFKVKYVFFSPCGPAFLLLIVTAQLKGYFENVSCCRGTITFAVKSNVSVMFRSMQIGNTMKYQSSFYSSPSHALRLAEDLHLSKVNLIQLWV